MHTTHATHTTERNWLVTTLTLAAALAFGVAMAQAGAPWQSIGRYFGVGHGPGYHAAAGCPGAVSSYCPAPCGWCGDPSSFPLPRAGWMPVAQPTIVTSGTFQYEAVPALQTPAQPRASVLVQ